MPTFDKVQQFIRDFTALSPEQQQQFLAAVMEFVEDLQRGGQIRPSLRVHQLEGHPGVYSLSWGYRNGMRATFHYGAPVRSGDQHVVWRRIGDHRIYDQP